MPGVKRKASFTAPYQRPQKLKKQSTSVSVARAIGTLKKAKSWQNSPVKLPRSSSVSPRKLSPQKSIKKPLPMPRFPTLKPTKPPPDSDALSTQLFYGSPKTKLTSASSFTKLKKAPTVLLNENSVTSYSSKLNKKLTKNMTSKVSTKTLSKKSTVKKDTLDDSKKTSESEGTITSSGMNSSLRKLPSGSTIGKIIKDDGLEEPFLPSDTSLAVYEFSEETAVTPSLDLSRTAATPPARQSAFDVADFFAAQSPSRDTGEKELISEQNGADLSNSSMEVASQTDDSSMCTDSDLSPTKTEPQLKELETPTKSPKKGLRGGVREIVFSFDTTGSMYSYLEEAREKIKEIVSRLQAHIPGVRLGFLAHGDYYDLQFDRYLIKWINFGASVEEISEFFEDLGINNGGDPDECYELVLRRVQDPTYVSWTPGSQRCLVMIGDSDPHEPGYTFDGKVNEIDWRQETEKLKDMGVRIYGLQIGYGSDFYRQISKVTGGAHLRLDAAKFMPDVIMAICLREGNLKLLKHYEAEVRSRAKKEGNAVDLELERLFSALKNIEDNKAFKPFKKTPSKSPSKKVKMVLDTKDKKKSQSVKRTLTPFISGSAKKAKLDNTVAIFKKEESTKKEKPAELTPKVKVVKEKSVKVVKKSTPSPKTKTLKAPAKQKKPTILTPKVKVVKEKSMKVVKKSTSSPKAKTLKTSVKQKKVVDRGKKVKRLGQSTKMKTSSQKKAKPVKKKVTAKVSAKKSTKVAKLSVGVKSKSKVILKKSKTKGTVVKGKKTLVKKKLMKGVKSGKSLKKTSPKGSVKVKKTVKKIVTKKKAIKKPGRPKAKITQGKPKAIKSPGKPKASKPPGRPKVNKTIGKPKAGKAQVKSKVSKSSGKPKVSKAKLKPKTLKPKKATKVVTKSSVKSAAKAKSLSKPAGKKMKVLTKSSVKITAKAKSLSKPAGKKILKPKVAAKSKGNVKSKVSVKTKIKGKIGPKKTVKAPIKKQPVKAAPKKVIKVEKTSASKKRPAPKEVEKRVKIQKTETKNEKTKKESKAGISLKSKGANGRLFRENVAGSNFATGPLSSLSWTQWTVFISPIKPKENSEKFISPKGWCSGYCNNELFKSEGIIQAVYEFAVAPPGGTKKYPVFYCATAGSSKINMKECLKNNKMKKEMDRVVKAKGTIFIRRGAFSACNLAKLKETRDYIKNNFDYAWGGNDQQYRKLGDIQKDGFIIAKALK